MPGSHLLHDLHCKLVVVGGNIRCCINRRQLMLRGSHLVVLRLGEDAQLPKLFVELLHVSRHSGLNDAEVMVVHLLAFRRPGAEQRTAGKAQIGSLFIHLPRDQEILLFRAYRCADAFDSVVAEQTQNAQRLLVQRLHGAQQRSLLVQRFAAVRAERGWNTQGFPLDKRIGGGIPGRVSSCLKGGAQAARREGRRVWFALNQLLA